MRYIPLVDQLLWTLIESMIGVVSVHRAKRKKAIAKSTKCFSEACEWEMGAAKTVGPF